MDQSQIGTRWSRSPGLSNGARPQAEVLVGRDSVIEDLQSPALGGLLGYWQSKRVGARPMPSRRDLDPVEMAPEWLPLVTLVDIEAGTGRLRFRLIEIAPRDRRRQDKQGQTEAGPQIEAEGRGLTRALAGNDGTAGTGKEKPQLPGPTKGGNRGSVG